MLGDGEDGEDREAVTPGVTISSISAGIYTIGREIPSRPCCDQRPRGIRRIARYC